MSLTGQHPACGHPLRESQDANHVGEGKCGRQKLHPIRLLHENLDYLTCEWVEKQRQSYAPAADSDYLFLTQQKPKMRPSYISRIVKEQAKEAGVNEPITEDANGNTRWLVTANTFRHSMASHSANGTQPADPNGDGIPVHMLAKVLGHRKLDTTMKYVSTDWNQIGKVLRERGHR
nr:tyrosine-type recombinase/integrase [Haloplanus natans]